MDILIDLLDIIGGRKGSNSQFRYPFWDALCGPNELSFRKPDIADPFVFETDLLSDDPQILNSS